MLSREEILIISEAAKKHNVSEVILFGSALTDNIGYNDIDIAVKGIDPKLFFKFYGELIRYLKKPVDVIDLSVESAFNKLIENEGIRIYG